MPNKTHPNPRHQFHHFFTERPEVLRELQSLGIRFEAIAIGNGEAWPGFVLPSKAILLVASDDEGNGPGAIHIADAA